MMNRLPLPPTRHPVASPAIVESQPRTVLASSVRRMAFQRQAVMLHDPQHPLGIDGRQAFGAPLSVQERRDASIAIGRPTIDNGPDRGKELGILRLAIGPTRRRGPAASLVDVGTSDVQRPCHRAHREPSVGSLQDSNGDVRFFGRATSSASLRISFSIALRPRSRSRSRTCFSRSAAHPCRRTSEFGPQPRRQGRKIEGRPRPEPPRQSKVMSWPGPLARVQTQGIDRSR